MSKKNWLDKSDAPSLNPRAGTFHDRLPTYFLKDFFSSDRPPMISDYENYMYCLLDDLIEFFDYE